VRDGVAFAGKRRRVGVEEGKWGKIQFLIFKFCRRMDSKEDDVMAVGG